MDANSQEPAPPSAGASRWIFPVLIVAAVGLYLAAAYSMRDDYNPQRGPAIGRRLPYLRLEPLTGDSKAVSLEDLSGHVTLVNYWGTWCPPCRRELPHIVDLAEHFGSRPEFRLYAVSCGQGSDEDLDALRATTEEFLEIAKVHLPTYSDQNLASRKALGLVLEAPQLAYPTTLLLDRSGAIRGFWQGYHPGVEQEMRRSIEELLATPAVEKKSDAT